MIRSLVFATFIQRVPFTLFIILAPLVLAQKVYIEFNHIYGLTNILFTVVNLQYIYVASRFFYENEALLDAYPMIVLNVFLGVAVGFIFNLWTLDLSILLFVMTSALALSNLSVTKSRLKCDSFGMLVISLFLGLAPITILFASFYLKEKFTIGIMLSVFSISWFSTFFFLISRNGFGIRPGVMHKVYFDTILDFHKLIGCGYLIDIIFVFLVNTSRAAANKIQSELALYYVVHAAVLGVIALVIDLIFESRRSQLYRSSCGRSVLFKTLCASLLLSLTIELFFHFAFPIYSLKVRDVSQLTLYDFLLSLSYSFAVTFLIAAKWEVARYTEQKTGVLIGGVIIIMALSYITFAKNDHNYLNSLWFVVAVVTFYSILLLFTNHEYKTVS